MTGPEERARRSGNRGGRPAGFGGATRKWRRHAELSLDRNWRRARKRGALLVLSRGRRLIGETFPWGTLIVNVVGSLIIGFFATITGPDGRLLVGTIPRQFVMIGICGGYTTFSSFSIQTLNLLTMGSGSTPAPNIVASVVPCLLAVWIGHVAADQFNALKWV